MFSIGLMENPRRRRFLDYFNGPLKGDRELLIRRSRYTKGRISQLFDDEQPFGEGAARNLAVRLGLAPDYFEREHEAGSLDAETMEVAKRYGQMSPEERQRFRALLTAPGEGSAPSVDVAVRMARLLTIISTIPAHQQLQALISAELAALHVRSGVADAANSSAPPTSSPREGHRPGKGMQPR